MVSNRETMFEPAKINARIDYRMSVGFFAFDDVKGHRMFDMITVLDSISAKPKAHEISAWLKEELTENKRRSTFLSGAETDKLPFLPSIRVDHAITISVVENDRQIVIGKTLHALQFYVDS